MVCLSITQSLIAYVVAVIDSRKKRKTSSNAAPDESGQPVATSLFAEDKGTSKPKSSARQNRLTNTQLKELEMQKEKEVVRNLKRLKELWPEMLAGEEMADREWMLEAEKLVDMFRETRNLFLTSRVSFFILGSYHLWVLSSFPKSNPFRGMLPPGRKKKRQDTEAEADNMASRLQLDLGRSPQLCSSFSQRTTRTRQPNEEVVTKWREG